jgi:hypothetical protein
MTGFDVSSIPSQPGNSCSQQVPLHRYRQAANLFLIQVNGVVFLSGHFVPQPGSLLFNEGNIFFGDISQTEQGLGNARVVLSEQRQQVKAKTISKKGRRQVGRITARLNLVFTAITRSFLSGNVQKRSDHQEIAWLGSQ